MARALEMKRWLDIARERWDSFFFRGYSADSLGLLRIALGLVLIPFFLHQSASLLALKADGPGFYYIEPIWYFALLGIDHHVPPVTFLAAAVLVLAGLGVALGLFTRASIVTVLLAVLYLKGVRDSISGDVHHREIIPFHILLLLLLSKAGGAYSVDNLIRKAGHRIEEWEASWPIKAMQLYFCFFYLWSAIAKVRMSGMAWLADGARLQEILLIRSVRYGLTETGDPAGSSLAYALAHHPGLLVPLGVATLALEFGFPALLLVRRARWRFVALLAVTVFHVSNYFLLNVQFLLLPLFFVVFFDLQPPVEWARSRRSGRST